MSEQQRQTSEQEFPGDEIVLETTGWTLGDYRMAISAEGPLDYEWSDKPHRLVYDLINEIKQLHGLSEEERRRRT